MKKIIIVCATIVALSAASVQASYNLTLELGSPRGGSGGEFKVTAQAGGSTPWSTIGLSDGDMFDSFCLETDENFLPGATPLYATLNTGAVGGGSNIPGKGVGFDQISKGTSWLFRQHWDLGGSLAGNIGGVSYATNADAVALQDAIWHLEDEITLGTPLSNGFLNAAATSLSLTAAQLKLDASPYEYGVGVLNIWLVDPDLGSPTFDATRDHRQDMLVVVPEPSVLIGTMASCFFGFIAFRRRRQNRKS